MQRFTRKFGFALGVTAALVFTGFAQAAELRRLEVSYGDLDLAKAESASALYWRIQHAAHNVCEANTVSDSRAVLIERKCVTKAVDDAIQSVDNANLTAIYLAKTGKRAMVASNR
jgi:UrcA family protein